MLASTEYVAQFGSLRFNIVDVEIKFKLRFGDVNSFERKSKKSIFARFGRKIKILSFQPTLTSWTELVLKDLSSSPKACEVSKKLILINNFNRFRYFFKIAGLFQWFFEHSSKHSDWLTEILIGSPSKINREMFQKLCLHAILQLHLRHEPLYLLPWEEG